MDVFSGDLCPQRIAPSLCPALSSLLSLLEKVPAVLWTTDLDLRFTALSGAALQGSGINPADFTGLPVATLFSPGQSAAGSALEAHTAARGGRLCSFETTLGGRDYDAHVQPLRGPDGSTIGVIGVALDETERLVAQRALHLSEQNHRSLIEEAPYAICRVTESGQFLQANRATSEMLGYQPCQESDLLMRDLPYVFAQPAAFNSFRDELVSGSTVHGIDATWLRRNGQSIQVRIGGRAVRDACGQMLYLDVLAENVTERKELEARLSQAEKMQAIGQLAGGVAHDFNNLLTVIGGQVELLLAEMADSGQRSRLHAVQQAAARASALTRQLLAFSRRQMLRSEVLDVNRLIGGVKAMLARLIRENIVLTFLPGPDAGCVKADPNQLEQVLMNLVVNAQDAIVLDGRIEIETSRLRVESAGSTSPLEPGDYACISVRDNGHGMDPEIMAHLFEPFFTTKKPGEGTGLGLATVYGIVRQSGGQIDVQSQSGTGSTFCIYLPQVPGHPEDAARPPLPEAAPRGLETVLLAEDEDSVRALLATQLAGLGYHVLAASNGMDALNLAHSYPGAIDLLVSDFVMPKLGGRELAVELRKTNPRLRVIFVSGYAGRDAGEGQTGILDTYFLGKPFSMQELAQTVRSVLDCPRP